MPTREEIRESMASRLFDRASTWGPTDKEWNNLEQSAKQVWLDKADEEIGILHFQGLVIAVEGELPSVTFTITAAITPDELMIIEKAYRKVYTGYRLTIPLKEK